ncbi:hypothetical protein CPB85DRAFT_1316445 [Mucidula mucida]|nr:hypothetical protein CPB85DRAFT_1316445 [Mucidula mucida]
MDLIQRARQCAASDEKHAWVLNHLPNMLASKDLVIGDESVQARMRDFLNIAEYADGKKHHYEDRCLRICVSEELHAITSLTSARTIAQVFLDILQSELRGYITHSSPMLISLQLINGCMMSRNSSTAI